MTYRWCVVRVRSTVMALAAAMVVAVTVAAGAPSGVVCGLADGVATVHLGPGASGQIIYLEPAEALLSASGPSGSCDVSLSGATSVRAIGGPGTQVFFLQSAGAPAVLPPIFIELGGDRDEVHVTLTSGDDVVTASGDALVVGPIRASLRNVEWVDIAGAGGADRIDMRGHPGRLRFSDRFDVVGDRIFMPAGGGMVIAGRGSDKVIGGPGSDVVFAHEGHDDIRSGGGNDRLSGGDDGDRLWSYGGDDFVAGDDGDDWLIGSRGADKLYGGDGDDDIAGTNGRDLLNGGDGNDRLDGDLGRDVIFGQDGADYLIGGPGTDQLNGGPGIDRCDGADDRRQQCERT